MSMDAELELRQDFMLERTLHASPGMAFLAWTEAEHLDWFLMPLGAPSASAWKHGTTL